MHNAGVLKGYQHETDIRNEIAEAASSQAALGHGAPRACLPEIATAFLPKPIIQYFEK